MNGETQRLMGQATVIDQSGMPQIVSFPMSGTTTPQQAMQALAQRGYQTVVKLERLPDPTPTATAPPPAPTPQANDQSMLVRLAGQFPKLTGAAMGGARGAALGARRGPFGMALGALGGAALGGGVGEGLYAAAQGAFGLPTGNVGERVMQAGKQGALAEMGARGTANVLRGGAGMLGRLGQRLMPRAAVAGEAGAESPLTTGLRAEAAKEGGQLDPQTFARTIRGPLRALLRSTTRTAKEGTTQQKEALKPLLGSLKQLTDRTISLAPIADTLAKDPTQLADLIRQAGPDTAEKLLPELQSAWLTAAVQMAPEKAAAMFADLGATGQKALFSTRAPALRRLFETAKDIAPDITPAKATRGAMQSPLARAVTSVVEAGGIAHFLPGGHYLAAPFLIGRLLTREGGAEWLTDVAMAARDSRMFNQVAPALARAGTQLLAGATEAAPAAARFPGNMPAVGFSGAAQ